MRDAGSCCTRCSTGESARLPAPSCPVAFEPHAHRQPDSPIASLALPRTRHLERRPRALPQLARAAQTPRVELAAARHAHRVVRPARHNRRHRLLLQLAALLTLAEAQRHGGRCRVVLKVAGAQLAVEVAAKGVERVAAVQAARVARRLQQRRRVMPAARDRRRLRRRGRLAVDEMQQRQVRLVLTAVSRGAMGASAVSVGSGQGRGGGGGWARHSTREGQQGRRQSSRKGRPHSGLCAAARAGRMTHRLAGRRLRARGTSRSCPFAMTSIMESARKYVHVDCSMPSCDTEQRTRTASSSCAARTKGGRRYARLVRGW
eukprot:67501-Chlamydomonas_euryale.AAC.6